MRNRHHIFLIPCLGLALMSLAACAFASGREGAQYVDAVRWIVMMVLVPFAALPLGGCLLGAFKARRNNASILRGSARGLLKGIVAFLLLAAISLVALTILSILWSAYAFWDVYD